MQAWLLTVGILSGEGSLGASWCWSLEPWLNLLSCYFPGAGHVDPGGRHHELGLFSVVWIKEPPLESLPLSLFIAFLRCQGAGPSLRSKILEETDSRFPGSQQFPVAPYLGVSRTLAGTTLDFVWLGLEHILRRLPQPLWDMPSLPLVFLRYHFIVVIHSLWPLLHALPRWFLSVGSSVGITFKVEHPTVFLTLCLGTSRVVAAIYWKKI